MWVATTLLAVALVSLPGNAAGVAVTEEYAVDASGAITVDGGGFGHGRGMSQYGAEGAARAGLTSAQILDFYYPTSTVGAGATSIAVKVDDQSSGGRVAVNGTIAGTAYALDEATGQTYSIGTHRYLQVALRAGATTIEVTDGLTYTTALGVAAGRVRLGVSSGFVRIVYADGSLRTVRGTVRAAPTGTGFYPVNDVTMDEYLMGVVASEMPASWHSAALETQAIAARTYATAYKLRRPSPDWDICATTVCQVYRGKDGEATAATAAVQATTGKIRVTATGTPINAEYSSSNGGYTASGGTSYTPAQADPYDGWSGNPVHRWTVTVDAATLTASFPSAGKVSSIRITSRTGAGPWGGYVLAGAIVGSKGTVAVTGNQLRAGLGLRSNLFGAPLSAILVKWASLGGVSYLGAPTSAEYAYGSMRAQDFVNGTIYWSAGAGAHCVFGAPNTYYRSSGGEALWGTPVGDSGGVSTGAQSIFTRGRIYWSAATGVWGVRGGLLAGYLALGGPAGLGFPSSAEGPLGMGYGQTFARGQLFWTDSRSIGVYGAVYARYTSAGGVDVLGPPATPEAAEGSARVQQFTRARIYWTPTYGARLVLGAVGARFLADGAVAVDGVPTSEEYPLGTAAVQQFTAAQLSWSPTTGTRRVGGAIRQAYLTSGGANSLGLPVTEEQPSGLGAVQVFAHGRIIWSPTTGAQVIRS